MNTPKTSKPLTAKQKSIKAQKAKARRAVLAANAKAASAKSIVPATNIAVSHNGSLVPAAQQTAAGATRKLWNVQGGYAVLKGHAIPYSTLMASVTLAAQGVANVCGIDSRGFIIATDKTYRADVFRHLSTKSAFNYWVKPTATRADVWVSWAANGMTPEGIKETQARVNGDRGVKKPNIKLTLAFMQAMLTGASVDISKSCGGPSTIIKMSTKPVEFQV